MKKYFLDLFSGIGGFALGAYWAGLRFDAHYFSEVDDYAIRVYQKRFPDAIPLGDIAKIDGRALPVGYWIIAGGFPCQDISVAGKGAGLEGSRSGLWYEYARLIGELRPRYAIMENVGALAFRGLDAVLGSLSEIGYDAEWQDIRASDVGAPHRRERIWIVAYPKCSEWWPERCSCDGLAQREDCLPQREKSSSGTRVSGEAMADAMRPRLVPSAHGGLCGQEESPGPRDEQSKRCGQALADSSGDGWKPRRPECEGFEGQPGVIGCGASVFDTASAGLSDRPKGTLLESREVKESQRSDWWAVEPDVRGISHELSKGLD